MTPAISAAEQVVARQLAAYNARDIGAFMATWTDDAQCFEHPAKPLARGAAEIRARHVARFKEANLRARLLHRMAVGNIVVDREIVTRTFPEGPGTIDVIAIYEITHDKIAKAWFVFGEPLLETAK